MQKVLNLKPEAAWQEHLRSSYLAVAEMHSASWVSWGKARFRKEDAKDTTVGTLGQLGATTSGVAGGLTLIGVPVPAVAAGAAVGAAIAAVSLYALPVAVTALATAVWLKDKAHHHNVNQDIWDYWCQNCRATLQVPQENLAEESAKRALDWFGAEGFYNMNYLGDKLEKAKKAFDAGVNAMTKSANDLHVRIRAARNLQDPQKRTQTLQQLGQEAETLASKFLELGKDLEYVRYRLERLLMYYQMLELATRSLMSYMKPKLDAAAVAVRPGFDQQIATYHELWHHVAKCSV
jgi:hypothetical protein